MLIFYLSLLFFIFSFWINNLIVYFLLFMIFMVFMKYSIDVSLYNINMELVYMDMISYMLIFLTLWIFILMIYTDMKKKMILNFFFFIFMNFCLVNFFISFNYIWLYIWFELTLIPIFFMIFFMGGQKERIKAGFFMFLYTLFFSLPLLIMIILMLKNIMIMNMMILNYLNFKIYNLFSMLFLFMAFLVKVPLYSIHNWLPKAHVEAPVTGSMILAGVLLKMGGFGLIKILNIFFYKKMLMLGSILVSMSLIGSMMIGLYCYKQVDVKIIIAYSSVCHMSFMIAGLMNLSMTSAFGSMILMIGHGLVSSALFFMSNLFYERFFSRNLMVLSGMSKFLMSVKYWWFLFLILNMSFPPSMNFMGEVFLVFSILKISIFLIILFLFLILINSGYNVFLFTKVYHGSSWLNSNQKFIYKNEINIMFMHFFPIFFFILKMTFFFNWM